MPESVGQFTGNSRGVPTRELESLTASVAVTASHAIYAERIGSETQSVGSGINPVFVGKGVITPISGTVGNETSSVYLKQGTITRQTASVGSATNPVYQNAGNITASKATVGSETQSIYLKEGEITQQTASVGTDTNPTYVINGKVTASKATVGSTDNPVYLDGGVLTPANRFSNFLPLTGGVITGPLGVTGSVSISGNLDVRHGDFYLSGAGEYDGTNQSGSDTVQEVLRKQGAALTALAAGAKVTLSPSPTVIYKNTTTPVTLTGTLSNVTPSSMRILDGTTVIASTESCARVQGTTSVNISSNTKSFSCEAIYMGVAIVSTATINARNPILYGFAASAAALTKKVSPVTSAVRTYSDVSTANGQHFYIAVPTDIGDVSQFAMGGAPFAMNAVTTQTINGISYKVHESAVAYNANTTVTVAASN